MKQEFWLERWQNNEITFHQAEVNPYLTAHWPGLQVPSGAVVFVPLCGRTHDMVWLREQGYRVLGVELSPIAVRDFFAGSGLQAQVHRRSRFEHWQAEGVTLLCGDLFGLEAADLDEVTAVYDRASLIAFPPDMRQRYVHKLASVLPRSAETLLVAMEYPQNQMSGPPFSVPEQEIRSLYEPQSRVVRLHAEDALEKNPRFRARGLTQLVEKVFHICPGG
ncbi:MAG: thiopurine S-methyltransferase [Pseudomonadota bacterium]|nr:thiopurine S-methyltransferase [Pseudomonadota bacterium]